MFRVVNLHDEPCDFYCGRKTSYHPFESRYGVDMSSLGNIYGDHSLQQKYSRKESIDLYEHYLFEKIHQKDVSFIKCFEKLYDASKHREIRLGCFCKPKRCHVDSIVKAFYILYPEAHNELFGGA